ncbi:hypothetical protein ACTI_52600 [Actinoplanes sp. OR16]|uniref:hypothetical protein n=1 Tax=Actinoplanes sp. OR16 TaxID=946334 RepID=UPI000F707F0A|nr:hypothetical protein [Actinoplanes sp. OR16]BBH68575.1 hypothetical protein ACTI_52600 [Actinoplanes sp. OR16]
MNPFIAYLAHSRRMADAYDLPDWILENTDLDMSRVPDRHRHVLEAGTLAGAVLSTADIHKADCARPRCDTCDALRDAVALAVVVIQAEAGRDLDLLPPRPE